MGEATSAFRGRRQQFWHQNLSRKISKATPSGHPGGFMEWFLGNQLLEFYQQENPGLA